MKVHILVIPEAMGSTITGPLDVLCSSNMLSAVFDTTGKATSFEVNLTSNTLEPVHCVNGLEIKPTLDVSSAKESGLILIPSLSIGNKGLMEKYPDIVRWIVKMHKQGSRIMSVCTGAFLLAETGLLNGKEATTHWAFADLFRKLYPKVDLQPNKAIIEQDLITTVGAGAAWHDLILRLIEKEQGRKVAIHSAKMFLLQNHVDGQKPYETFYEQFSHSDLLIQEAQKWLANNLDSEDAIQKCAQKAGLNDRTFKRRFKKATGFSPLVYIQKIRVERAKEMLEVGKEKIDVISLRIGYEDTSFFRRVFKRETGLSPNDYRKKFGMSFV